MRGEIERDFENIDLYFSPQTLGALEQNNALFTETTSMESSEHEIQASAMSIN